MGNDLLRRWLAWGLNNRQWAPGTAKLYEARIKAADAWMQAQGWHGVTRGTPEAWFAWWESLPDTASSRNLGRNALMSYGAFLAATGRRVSNPAAGIPAWRQRRGVPRPLPLEQSRRLLSDASGREDMSSVLVTVLLLTGLRISEAAALKWADYDGAWLHVRGKGGVVRRVPVPAPLVRCLRRWRPVCPSVVWVFPGRDGHMSTQNLRKRFKDYTDGATPHRARHSWATALLAESHDITVVQAGLGHADVSTSMVYSQTSPRRLAEAVSRLYAVDEDAA